MVPEKKESSSVLMEEKASLPEGKSKDNWDIIRQYKDENGNVDIDMAREALPELNKSLTSTLRKKQTDIVESISMTDIQGAGLRDKAMSSKALHDQAMELEQGRPMGNIQVFYIKKANLVQLELSDYTTLNVLL